MSSSFSPCWKTFISDECTNSKHQACLGWTKQSPCMKHLNRVMTVIVKPTFVLQFWTKVVEVELASVTNQLQSMIDLDRHIHQKESNPLHWNRTDTRITWDIQLMSNWSNPPQNFIRICLSTVQLPHRKEPLKVNRNHHLIINCKIL